MKKISKIVWWLVLAVIIISIILFFVGPYSFKKMSTSPEFQKSLKEVERKNPGVVSQSSVDISLIPQYGGFQKTPEQVKADEEFVTTLINKFKDKRIASNETIKVGNKYYQKEDLNTAIRRYNQAWLLDDTNPEVYTSFGNILKKRGDESGANEMFQKANSLK
jgi:tetratricopeptide (TPR) repeat protein